MKGVALTWITFPAQDCGRFAMTALSNVTINAQVIAEKLVAHALKTIIVITLKSNMAYNNTQQGEKPIFADGMTFKEPHERAPAFVKGSISIKVDKFVAFLNAHANEKGWVTLDMKESKSLVTYFQLNTWKPEKTEGGWKPKPQSQAQIDEMKNRTDIEYPEEDINPDDIPF